MKRYLLLLSLIGGICPITVWAKPYQTGSYNDQIKTLQVHRSDSWSELPVITLHSDEQVKISFDELSHDYKRLAYRLIHCDKSWSKSDLNELEYLDGFADNDIENYEPSNGTYTLYTHYELLVPNEQIHLNYSGNYALIIYDKYNGTYETPLAVACFSVVEPKTAISVEFTANTDIDFEQQPQQLKLETSPMGFTFRQPETELSLELRQNNRPDNAVTGLKPLYIHPDKLVYDHHRHLIFEGGNEYRRFEITSYKHTGMGVYRISYTNGIYQAELMEDETRLTGYRYDQDQDGLFLIHQTESASDETGADYFLVHFCFPMVNPLPEGDLYLNGCLVGNQLNETSKMDYDLTKRAYCKTLLLKQGAYNYQYLFVPSAGGQPTTLLTEGSYWQTENEYTLYVYYRPIGGRYDQLIGFKTVKTSF
jgi:hypothetical protein